MSATTKYGGSNITQDIDLEDNSDVATERFVEEASDLLNDFLLNPQNEEINDTSASQIQLSSEDVGYADAVNTSIFLGQEKKKAVYNINLWTILRKGAINLVLPFINGMMLGFGEILAHEIGFHYNWVGAKVEPPRRIVQKNKRNQSTFL